MGQKKVLMIGIKKEKKMSSRFEILLKIKANKPDLLDLPIIDETVFYEDIDHISEFKKKVEIVGGNVFESSSNQDVINQVKSLYPSTALNFSVLEGTEAFNTIDLNTLKKPHDLVDLDVLILKGTFGVAENGAIWISDKQLLVRVLPFITKHLILVIKHSDIVPYLHQGYELLKGKDNDFGVLLSGPSKTADIEQSLVIGAQGALSLSVFLMQD